MVLLIYLFLEHFLRNDPAYADVLRMHYLFHIILGVLSTGPAEAPHHTDKLRLLIVEPHTLFARLSTSLKPKLHQFHHIIDGIEWLGKSLSCFVTERKHRIVKDSALHFDTSSIQYWPTLSISNVTNFPLASTCSKSSSCTCHETCEESQAFDNRHLQYSAVVCLARETLSGSRMHLVAVS